MVDTFLLLLLLLLLSLCSKVLSLSCHLEFKLKTKQISPSEVLSPAEKFPYIEEPSWLGP